MSSPRDTTKTAEKKSELEIAYQRYVSVLMLKKKPNFNLKSALNTLYELGDTFRKLDKSVELGLVKHEIASCLLTINDRSDKDNKEIEKHLSDAGVLFSQTTLTTNERANLIQVRIQNHFLLGLHYKKCGKFQLAIDEFNKNLVLMPHLKVTNSDIKDQDARSKQLLGKLLENYIYLAHCYLKIKDLENSYKMLAFVNENFNQCNNTLPSCALVLYGRCLFFKKMWSEALVILLQASKCMSSEKDIKLLPKINIYLAICHIKNGDLNSARTILLNSTSFFRKLNDWFHHALSLYLLEVIEEKRPSPGLSDYLTQQTHIGNLETEELITLVETVKIIESTLRSSPKNGSQPTLAAPTLFCSRFDFKDSADAQASAASTNTKISSVAPK